MGFVWELVLGLAVAVVVWAVYKLRKLVYFFDDRKIPYVAPIWPLGSDWRGSLHLIHFGLSWTKMYKQLAPHKIGGFYAYVKPIVMVRDPEYINRIMTTDFSYFYDRPFIVDEKKDPLDGHLFFLAGDKWKFMRNKLSPIFTSGKLKWMFEQIHTASDKFSTHFDTKVPLGQEVDIREEFARYTTDVITSCAFGIDSNAMGDPDSRFREMGKKFFLPSVYEVFKFIARFAIPNCLIALKIRTTPLDITQFFLEVVQQAFHHRLSTGFVRKDFVQLLLELREKGEVVSDESRNGDAQRDLSNEFPGNKKEAFEVDDDLVAAQLFVFFIAGFETTASTLNNLMYLLSLNEHCQEEARTEVLQVMEKNNGTLTYDGLKELTYLDNCISETLRMMPPVPMNFRVCTKDYEFPDGTKIEKGTPVVIPTYSTHYDPQYYPNPNVFKPERFENPPPKGTYTPFGDGPRICIGKRFAEVSMKLSFGKLLAKYQFKPASQKSDVSDWVPGSLFLLPKQPLKVIIEKIA